MFLKATLVVLLAIGLGYMVLPLLRDNEKISENLKNFVADYIHIARPWTLKLMKGMGFVGQTYTADDIQSVIDAFESTIKTPAHCLNEAKRAKMVQEIGATGTGRLFRSVAVGINANIDVIVSGTKLLSALNIKPGAAKDHNQVGSKKDLQEVFHYSLKHGAAAERPLSNGVLYEEMTTVNVSRSQTYIGGNAALMAFNMMKFYSDVKVTLVGPVGPRLKELLTPRINVPEFSQFEEDEIHLIMEYEKGEKWGESVAPVANRFITSHDRSNTNAVVMDLFFNIVEEHKVDLVILSGLHLLDGQPEPQWRSRLTSLVSRLDAVPRWRPVHLELASMTNAKLVKFMAETIFAKVASLGLNEQELLLTSQVCGGPHKSLKTENNQLDIRKVGDTLNWLMAKFGYSEKSSKSRLSRIHFHTLAFHITATSGNMWGNQVSATGAGARVGGQKACKSAKVAATLFDLKIPDYISLHSKDSYKRFDYKNPIFESKSEAGVTLIFSPVLVCKKPIKTVGLGDAISSTGLMYSTFP